MVRYPKIGKLVRKKGEKKIGLIFYSYDLRPLFESRRFYVFWSNGLKWHDETELIFFGDKNEDAD